MGKRGQLEWDTLIPWIIGFVVLVLGFIMYEVLYGKGTGALSAFKNFLRMG